jgi:hypothetical protein
MRAWIIGNGKSLRETPLELLQDEPFVIAMNNIDLLYDPFEGWEGTDWRPTHYIKHEWEDRNRGLRSMARHMNMKIPCYLNGLWYTDLFMNIPAYWPPIVIPIQTVCHHSGSNATRGNQPSGWHLPKLCCFASTVGVAAQVAVLEGADELVFVGCDLGYEWYNMVRDGDPNHFHPAYGEADMFPIEERDETLVMMHEIIAQECKDRGVNVFNATVGGKLEVHERKSIEDIINDN